MSSAEDGFVPRDRARWPFGYGDHKGQASRPKARAGLVREDEIASTPESELWPHPACLAENVLLEQCDVVPGRSGGPGGQNRNKVSTQITLKHLPTGLMAQAGERRSQMENRHVAVVRLRLVLAVEHRAAVPKGRGLALLDLPAGSVLWRSRVRGRKIACNPSHWDFPSMLAEAMDVLADMGFEPRRAALMLDVSASQLIRLVAEHPPALLLVNAERQKRGKHALKP